MDSKKINKPVCIEEKSKTKLRVWLADLTYTGQDTQSLGADTFPLAVGCLATYSEEKIEFKEPIKIFRYPEKIAETLKNEGVPDVMGFSNFIWNSELSLRFAQRIKKMNPNTIVVMGGPNFPQDLIEREEFLK